MLKIIGGLIFVLVVVGGYYLANESSNDEPNAVELTPVANDAPQSGGKNFNF